MRSSNDFDATTGGAGAIPANRFKHVVPVPVQVTSRSQTGSVDPAARPAADASGSTRWIMRGVAGLVATLRIWWERGSARAQLRQMDDYRLADIGLSRAEAQAEAAKPFWRA